jgi:CRISPR-associated endonuclease Cas1
MIEHSNPSSPDARVGIPLSEVFEREPRDPSILIADGYGLRIHVERGHLVIHDGIGTHRRTRRIPRVERTNTRLLILGHTGGITLDALTWCHDVGITVTQLDPVTGRILIAIGAAGRDDPRLRRAQALAPGNQVGLAIARTLISTKIARQAGVLRTLDEHHTADTLDQHAATVEKAQAFNSITESEAKAASAYFAAWTRRITIRYATRGQTRVPEHWHGYEGRRSVLDYGRSPRKAATPINAMLNYAYALAEGECRIALVAVGLDPGLGIVHADKLGRDSLALDMIEPIRPRVDATILDLVEARPFRAEDFHETPSGQVRVLAPLTHEIAELARGWIRDIHTHAELIANALANGSAAPIRTSTPLTGDRRRNAMQTPKPTPSGRRPRKQAPAASSQTRRCRDCGIELPDTARKLCPACWPISRAKQARARAANGAAALAAARAEGQDPSNTPEARAKRHVALISDRAARAAWERENPNVTPDYANYHNHIGARLSEIALVRITDAIGVSISAASKMRAGKLTPHPRHWETLRSLVE